MVTDTRDPEFVAIPTPPRALPLVRVPDIAPLRAFYVDRLGCPATLDMDGYLQVQLTPFGERGPQVGFIVEQGANGTSGVILGVPVADADQVQAHLTEADVAIASPASDKPWGWRSLHVVDPSGLVLELFHVLDR